MSSNRLEEKVESKQGHTEEKDDSYTLHFLTDNKPETIAEARMNIKGGSAVLLYPADPNSHGQEAKYNACFIHKGKWVQKDKKLKTVPLGSLNLKEKNNDAIIQMALSKAGIIKDPSTIAQDMTRYVISSFLDSASLANFSITCRRAKQDVRQQLHKRAHAKLLQHIIYGEKDQAEAMLKQASELPDKTLLSALLLGKDTVASYSFGLDKNNPVKMKGTALQIAAGADDVDVIINGKKVVDGMAEMIASYLGQLPDGEALIAKQMQEQFPDDKSEEERCLRDMEALNKVVKAIEDATDAECKQALAEDVKPDNRCEAALAEFRHYLEPKDVITTGKQFNAEFLLHAWKLYIEKYAEKYAAFGGVDSFRDMLFWHKIIGYIRRFLPANLAHAFTQGLYYIVEKGEKLDRSLKLGYDNDIWSFQLSGLAAWGLFALPFQNLCQAKTRALQNLCNIRTIQNRASV